MIIKLTDASKEGHGTSMRLNSNHIVWYVPQPHDAARNSMTHESVKSRLHVMNGGGPYGIMFVAESNRQIDALLSGGSFADPPPDDEEKIA